MTTHREVPKEVAGDPSWQAAFIILNSEYFSHRAQVWSHVDLKRSSIFFDKILEHPWSSSEQRLLEIAASMFSDEFPVNLYRALGRLDDRQAILVLTALGQFLGISVKAGF